MNYLSGRMRCALWLSKTDTKSACPGTTDGSHTVLVIPVDNEAREPIGYALSRIFHVCQTRKRCGVRRLSFSSIIAPIGARIVVVVHVE